MLSQVHEAWLVEHRKLDPELLARFDIKSQGNMIAVPMCDPKTGASRMKLRRWPANDGEDPWIWGKGDGTPVFNGDVLLDSEAFKNGTRLVITEGEWDCLVASHATGFGPIVTAVAVGGYYRKLQLQPPRLVLGGDGWTFPKQEWFRSGKIIFLSLFMRTGCSFNFVR